MHSLYVTRKGARAAMVAALAGCLWGCASLHYHVAPGPPGDALLIPPRVRVVGAATYIVAYPGAVAAAGCRVAAGHMRLETTPGALTVTPTAESAAAAPFTPAESLQPGAVIQNQRRLNRPGEALAAGLDQLLAQGCLPLQSRLDPLTRVLEAMPLSSDQLSDFTAGEPVALGYVPLRFGEQLRVTAPLLDAKGQWSGATTLWYGLRLERDGRLRLVPPPASAMQVVHDGRSLHAQALDLPAAPVARYWRMIIFGREDNFTAVNILVGAPDPGTLSQATALVQAHSDGCAHVAAPAWCTAPKYGTVINIELSVRVQGRWLALPPASDVAAALRLAGAPPAPAAPRGLEVLRPYGGKLIPVTNTPGSSAILRLVLLGGEQIRWH